MRDVKCPYDKQLNVECTTFSYFLGTNTLKLTKHIVGYKATAMENYCANPRKN
jgi:hypothetical protein